MILTPGRKGVLLMAVRLPESQEIDTLIDEAGFETMPYETRYKQYRLRLTKDDINNHRELIKNLLQRSYAEWK